MIVRLDNFLSRLFSFIPGQFFGIASTLIGLVGDILGIIFYSGYNLNLMISILGTGPGGFFFNFGTILSGILALFLYLYLERVLSNDNVNRKLRKAALVSAIISCIFFIAIGIFPSYEDNLFFLYAHGISTLFCFISGAIYLVLFSYIFKKSSIFPNTLAYIGYFQTILITIFLFTWIPLTEWLMTFGIIIWVLSVSVYMIYKSL